MGQEGNPREILLAAQESLERWKEALDHDEDQDDAITVERLLALVELYAAGTPATLGRILE